MNLRVKNPQGGWTGGAAGAEDGPFPVSIEADHSDKDEVLVALDVGGGGYRLRTSQAYISGADAIALGSQLVLLGEAALKGSPR